MYVNSYANRGIKPKNYKWKDDIMIAYIYEIKNLKNNKCYIGQTSQKIGKREWKHFNDLKKNKHHSKKLQEDYNKYGIENFTSNILEKITDESIIREREIYWINLKDSINNGYNMTTGGEGVLTKSFHKNASNSHIGIRNLNRTFDDETAKKIYSIQYFYGSGMIRPLSRILNRSRDSIKRIEKYYDNIRCEFNNLDYKNKFSIFKKYNNEIGINIKLLNYLPKNIYYLILFYYNDNIYNIKGMALPCKDFHLACTDFITISYLRIRSFILVV